jgi:predicted Holliday junction resolvase-like endonuclease
MTIFLGLAIVVLLAWMNYLNMVIRDLRVDLNFERKEVMRQYNRAQNLKFDLLEAIKGKDEI